MGSIYTFERIEEYLAGDLSETANLEFEQQLAQDPGLAAEVKAHQEAHKAVELYAKIKVKDKVQALHAQEQKIGTTTTWRITRMAATLVLLAMAFFGYQLINSNYSNRSLASGNFESYPNRFTTMSDNASDHFSAALALYDKKEFAEALLEFQKVPTTSQNYVAAQLYLGIAYFSIDRIAEATTAFETIIQTPGMYQEVARWYLALCYLENNQVSKSRLLLEVMVKNQSYRWEKAQEILRKLDSPWRKLPGI